nr:reverse transcriptase domain-containing protein [Tanacetum cinerariifolium]
KCRSSIMWTELKEGHLIGSELVQETTEKISQIKDRLKAARDRQKSYADKRRKPLDFSVEIIEKVGPMAYRLDLPEELDGVHETFHVSNLKKCLADPTLQGKLAPRFVGPFEIIDKVGPVAYRLDLLKELDGVHDTFHVSNLKKCFADPTLQPANLPRASSESVTLTASERILMSSLECSDGVIRNVDVVSKRCKPNLEYLRVKLQSCPASSQIESKLRVFPSNAIQMLKTQKETIKH